MTSHSPSSKGRPAREVLADLATKQNSDVRWAEGRTFGLVFDGGEGVRAVAEEAARLFLHTNALNTFAFPSLGAIQADLCHWTSSLLHGGEEAAGFLTSGGTESILCAVEAARERARAERGVKEPELVLAESAHAAFHKAAHLFGLRTRVVGVVDDCTADLGAMTDAVGPNTALVVASAPQYPHGVVDPVVQIAELAASVGASCHVDACMGGFFLPFAEMEGRQVSTWDFRAEGVTSISADLHKLGYAPKGVSVLLHRTRDLRRYQIFDFDGWTGGRYVTPNLQGTRSGLPMAAAWAVVEYLGVDGYRRLVRMTLAVADRIRERVSSVDGLRVLGNPVHHLLAIAADSSSGYPIQPYALGDAMAARGWYHDRQGPPESLHLTVSAGNAAVVDEYLADLSSAAEESRNGRSGRPMDYATLE